MQASSFVRGERLWRHQAEMARFGATPGGGIDRQAFTAAEIAARQALLGWARARGYAASLDGIANLFIRRPGRRDDLAPVLVGSHLDSQPQGGRFDGTYGVLAGFEALEALDDSGITTERPVELVAWSNEEGSRFRPGAMGSQVFVGALAAEALAGAQGNDGVPLAQALAATRDAFAGVPRRAAAPVHAPVHAYVEAHIEQGPVLEQLGAPIGVVTGVAGARWFDVTLSGRTAHAGTTPLAARQDALQAALRCIAALNDAMADPADRLRFTVGRLTVAPNVPNSVASLARFSIDLRHPDAAELEARAGRIATACAAAAPPCALRIEETMTMPPAPFDPGIAALIEARARALGLAVHRLPSGAFHDAAFLGRICPAGMIFIPCAGGISHNEAENVTPEDALAGACVLADVLGALAGA
ncbi:Beta-ureidopropionase [Rhodovastum atsumiense]|uniref:M20 family metallo-hydrolase n=1 Tax=Rhodovastum atsumiense TaxID=504468 RepID=A0A5M6IYJ0_9PROT|nr:M20 family metallo-hydrolase [Rhodovastum atsumiense]KAA5613410.1 M20 family metallo-hydrolase [Rhodovastum atsumiense]CAH2603135.1 Beta-ureidopropionase [Rhodovastum atsumiense]